MRLDHRLLLAIAACTALAGCGDNFTPHEKTATYDPVRGELNYPYPCPDWSQTGSYNYLNETHSNFGCAVNNNSAAQLAEPSDLMEGHGDTAPDTEITTHVIEQYRAGTIPVPLVPLQDETGATQ